MPHGTVSRYTSKDRCRCDQCRAAMADYHAEQRRKGIPDSEDRCIPRSWLIADKYPERVR